MKTQHRRLFILILLAALGIVEQGCDRQGLYNHTHYQEFAAGAKPLIERIDEYRKANGLYPAHLKAIGMVEPGSMDHWQGWTYTGGSKSYTLSKFTGFGRETVWYMSPTEDGKNYAWFADDETGEPRQPILR